MEYHSTENHVISQDDDDSKDSTWLSSKCDNPPVSGPPPLERLYISEETAPEEPNSSDPQTGLSLSRNAAEPFSFINMAYFRSGVSDLKMEDHATENHINSQDDENGKDSSEKSTLLTSETIKYDAPPSGSPPLEILYISEETSPEEHYSTDPQTGLPLPGNAAESFSFIPMAFFRGSKDSDSRMDDHSTEYHVISKDDDDGKDSTRLSPENELSKCDNPPVSGSLALERPCSFKETALEEPNSSDPKTELPLPRNESFSFIPMAPLASIEEHSEIEKEDEAKSAKTKFKLRSVLKNLVRGSSESRAGSVDSGGGVGGERRGSSVFRSMLKRVSIHRKDSAPIGRIDVLLYGPENVDAAEEEEKTDNPQTELVDHSTHDDHGGHEDNGRPGSNGGHEVHGGHEDHGGHDGHGVAMRHNDKNKNAALLDSFFLILSGLYGILIVVLGAVIPLTEIFVKSYHNSVFEAFYIYLYVVSVIFLAYVYIYLLRRNRLKTEFLTRTLSRSLSFTKAWARSWARGDSDKATKYRKRMVSLDETNHHTGTFYLRLGVLGFGIGSMIHSGLEFGKFFEVSGKEGCGDPILAVKPLLHLIFTFSQLYFVFMNSKMCVHRYKKVARFGLMHMASTNLCVWFRSIVVETLHEIHAHGHHDDHGSHDSHDSQDDHASDHGDSALANFSTSAIPDKIMAVGRKLHAAAGGAEAGGDGMLMSEFKCQWSNMMGKAVEAAGPYLYPCTIEYSIMCAGILYVMWNNVGIKKRPATEEMEEEEQLKHQRMSVDCSGSSRGLFLGILLTVAAVIAIIAFYVMVSQPGLKHSALLLTHLSETIIYILTTAAIVLACARMRHLQFHSNHESDMEEILILLGYTGLLAFNIFSLIAAFLNVPGPEAALTIVSNFTMILQSTLQTIFMLAGDRMSAADSRQERKKPGREYVTFLLLSNFAMWIINTFETQKPEHNPLQVLFYGSSAWSIFSHISVPLGIYYRFHSTVCLSNIWKNAWKRRKHGH